MSGFFQVSMPTAHTCTTWQVIAACAMSKSLTTAKLLNATNARSKSTVNSSQRRQTRRSTWHTILRWIELTVWRIDWFPMKSRTAMTEEDRNDIGPKWQDRNGHTTYKQYSVRLCSYWKMTTMISKAPSYYPKCVPSRTEQYDGE